MFKYSSKYSQIYLNKPDIGINYDSAINNKFEKFIFELEKHYLYQIIDKLQHFDKKYLDFACGTGRILEFIINNFKFKKYTGCDISEKMVEVARDKFKKNTNIFFVVGN